MILNKTTSTRYKPDSDRNLSVALANTELLRQSGIFISKLAVHLKRFYHDIILVVVLRKNFFDIFAITLADCGALHP